LNIAFISSEYPHENLKPSAGLGSSIKNLAKGLVQSGMKVTVFTVFQNKNHTFFDDNIKIISIARKGYKVFGWYLERKHIQREIQKEIDAQGIDVIEAPDWTGITAFFNVSIPVIIRLHGSDAYFCHLENRKQKKKHKLFEQNALQNADKIISVSAFTAQVTTDLFQIKKNIEVIHNGIDTEYFKPIAADINTGQLLYFGTVIRKKGVLELARIFNKVVSENNEASLLLIGKDTMDVFENQSTLSLFNKLLSNKAKQKVTHIPEVPYEDIKNYIAKAHIVVLPSFAEAFPMTWLEALAMGKPLVSSNIGWAKEIVVDKKTGYTVDPKNHERFAEIVIRLLVNSELANTMGSSGRDYVVKHFSSAIITKQNIDFYKYCISE